MSSTAKGMLTGFLALTMLQAVLSSGQATGRVGGLFTGASSVIERLASPAVPLIPDLRTTAAATTPTTTPTVAQTAATASTLPRLV